MKKLLMTLMVICISAGSVFALTFNEAKIQKKPIVVMLHMHGCSACKVFEPRFDKIAAKSSDKFNFVKEDIHNSDIAKTLNFSTVPAMFIVDPNTMNAIRIEDDCAWDDACFYEKLSKY